MTGLAAWYRIFFCQTESHSSISGFPAQRFSMFPQTVPVRFWNDLLYSITLASVLVMTFLGEASTNWGGT